ncbi:liprin-beta-1 [Scaptodrosophila lebanonensis]|uniref:Liprin-beta-1 n=1 Tax=Drosophila lebanonensis TaxID=7225 RepID=A0A6J2TE55_DROLE|nr:liprin-beta-1 [Scaptodrosophila lebanonensis]
MASTEASKMLEAALQQMDGIISSTAATSAGHQPGASLTLNERNLISATNVLSTAKTLALALQQVGLAAPAPDPVTAAIISDWLETHIPRQDSDERMRRLQRDKEGLALQYQMVVERLSEQADKIVELEGLLTEKTQQLCSKDEQLQRQMISKSALETQKLELMSALSELKLHRTALERENELHANDGGGIPYGSMGNINQKAFVCAMVPKTPPSALRHQIKPRFHSLPRSHGAAGKQALRQSGDLHNHNNRALDVNANSSGMQRNVAFASNEQILIPLGDSTAQNEDAMYSSFISQTQSTPSPKLRPILGFRFLDNFLRRSNSSSCELTALEQAEPEFRRGGSRATTGGRIEWSAQTPLFSDASKHYSTWDAQEVCNWLSYMGLGCYEENCRKWLKANPTVSFFSSSPVDIERELHLKLPLHRKKIKLAIDDITGKEFDELTIKAANLDVGWVLRWLDDIGLPQYKDHFLQAKVDGRMLHRLTLEDLTQLQVSSCLHIASLRCGIQCMRRMNWNAESLIRRSTKEILNDSNDEDDSKDSDSVELWTAHRVMEWLRVVDLSEYAPNLRGAGVHGALMLYEPRFNANLLADLLSIPPSKSLLRRHLATHFKELVGRTIIHGKRDAEAEPGYQPLTIAAKLKPPKRAQFTLKRRKSTKGQNEVDWTEYVCPMNTGAVGPTPVGEHEDSISSNKSVQSAN